MITKHHIDVIQVSNSLDLKMTTGPLWGPIVNRVIAIFVINFILFLDSDDDVDRRNY